MKSCEIKRQKEYKTFLICAIVCLQTLKNALNKGLYQTGDYSVMWQVHPTHEEQISTKSAKNGLNKAFLKGRKS